MYQQVRLVMGLVGFALFVAVFAIVDWFPGFIIAGLAGVMALHARWNLSHPSDRDTLSLLLDLNALGVAVTLARLPAAAATGFVFIMMVVALQASRRLMTISVFNLLGWMIVSFFVWLRLGDRWSRGESALLSVVAIVFFTVGLALLTRALVYRLDQAERARMQAIGSIAHELRTPLTGLVGFSSILMDSISDMTPDEISEIATTIHEESQEAARITEDLLTISRIERQELGLNLETVDLSNEASAVLRTFLTPDRSPPRLEGGPALAQADSLRVRQIIRNLVTNALRYGGSDIEVTTRSGERWAVVAVSDDGDGIAQAEEDTVFEAFQRGSSGTAVPQSIGLGLSISRRLAHLMGGRLTYRRDNGRTVFELTLPAPPPGKRVPTQSN